MARQGHQPIVSTLGATHAHETVGGHAAFDERPHLRLDEARQAAAVRGPREERLELRAHDAVQELVLAPPGKRQ